MSDAAISKNIVQLSVAYRARQEKRKAQADDFVFEVGRIVMMPERDRIRWVRVCEKYFGFSVLEKSPAKKKKSTLKQV
jgi:hypothetical protein